MHIGEKVKLLRQINGMNQEMLSEKIGKTRALISHIEKTGKVNHETFLSIIDCFNISEQDFKNFEGNDIKIGISKDKKQHEAIISELREVLARVKKENEMLKDIVASQKEIISLLKEKTNNNS